MTHETRRPTDHLDRQWRELQGWVAPTSVCWRLDEPGRALETTGPSRFTIREMFVRADRDQRRRLDLLCAALVRCPVHEHNPPDAQLGKSVLVVLGPEVLRPQLTVVSAGVSVSDWNLFSSLDQIDSISALLFLINRGTDGAEAAGSIERLGQMLDFPLDRTGSVAVAQRIIRRLGILALTPGASAVLGGEASRSPSSRHAGDSNQLVVDRNASTSLANEVEVRDGRVVEAGPDGKATPWHGSDFVLVGDAQPQARRTDIRGLLQMRNDQVRLREAAAVEAPREEQTFSFRVAKARQAVRAESIVRLALDGDAAAASDEVRLALARPGAVGPLVESLIGRITNVSDYWLVDAALKRGLKKTATQRTRKTGRDVRTGVGSALETILGLNAGSNDSSFDSSQPFFPVVTPIRIGVSDQLVPVVDSRMDGGHFLYELIPVMRERIQADIGVRVPGVRAQGDPSLPPGAFRVEVDECRYFQGQTSLEVNYEIRPDAPGTEIGELTAIHPQTGERGRWHLFSIPSDVPLVPPNLTPAEYLIHHIERVVRSNLIRYLGPEEVQVLVEQAAGLDDNGLKSDVLPDSMSQLRLTWLLQRLVRDMVPIHELKTILSAIRESGGLSANFVTTRRAVRASLRQLLPGRNDAQVVRVPAALLDETYLDPVSGLVSPVGSPELTALCEWLEAAATKGGPAVNLVACCQEHREIVAAIVRPENPFAIALAEDELELS